ncbi:MAG: tetratricopeptide repeat protein, partial [Deltaproteobacteria bacterium]
MGLLNSLNYLIMKNNPLSYHLTNVILHALNTILVFIFLRLFFKAAPSFLGACLFAVHPVHVEAVAWITAGNYIMISLFILATYLLYHTAFYTVPETRKKPAYQKIRLYRYLISLSLFSYFLINNFSFYFLLPLFLVVSDITFNRWRRNWKLWLPYLAVVFIRLTLAKGVISARIDSAAREMGTAVAWHNPFPDFIYSVFTHLGLLLWPARLTLYHQPINVSATGLVAGALVLLALAAAIPFLFRKAKAAFFGVIIFILFLAPTYSPVTITSLVAERYDYFPSLALGIFAAFCYERLRFKNEGANKYILLLLIFAVAACGVRTVARNEDWKNQSRLWRSAVAVSPKSPWAHNNMGYAYQSEGNFDGALVEYKKAIELKPNLLDAYNNLGTIYQRIGRSQEAIDTYNTILKIDPAYVKAYNNIGVIYNEMGKTEDAIAVYKKALEINPNYAYGYFNLSTIYFHIGKSEEARVAYNRALEIDPSLKNLPVTR